MPGFVCKRSIEKGPSANGRHRSGDWEMENRPGRITGRLKAAIHGSFFGIVLLLVLAFAVFRAPGSDDTVLLTQAEKQWLAAHPTITHHIESDGITNLRLAGSIGRASPLGFAVRRDWPELAAILDKGLAAIGREERNAIYRKWVRLDRDTLFSHREFWFAVAVGLAVVGLAFAGLVAWNRSLKSLVGRRTRELSDELAERKLAEESLRIAEAKYHGIFENAVEGIYQTTPDGQCTEVNPACARIFGYDSPEDLKRSVRDVGARLYGDPEQRLECLKIMEERDVAVIELEIRRKDGSTGWVSNNVRAVRDGSGRLTHLEGIVEDVTELKRAEEELWKARNDLALKVEARTAELKAANEELQREITGHRLTQTALRAAERIVLSVEDNGVGFTASELSGQDNCEEGFGLAGMRERAEFSGGTLFLWSITGQGTRIEVLWPRKTSGR